MQKPLLYYNNNLTGTITLLEVMAAHGCKKVKSFLFFSHASMIDLNCSKKVSVIFSSFFYDSGHILCFFE